MKKIKVLDCTLRDGGYVRGGCLAVDIPDDIAPVEAALKRVHGL
ncbi:hypothetical protein [Limnospira platensis]|nr:hypothetical protein APLC1_2260 [Arthrospira platensis C1]